MLTHSKERTYACVQCQRSWGGTWSPTVGRKYTTVNNAESPLAELVIWRGTCSFTVGRSHTIAHNAILRLHTHMISDITSKHIPYKSQNSKLVIWRGTCSFTVGRSHTIAHNAILRLHTHMISDITSKHIPYKSQNSANGASTPQSNDQAL